MKNLHKLMLTKHMLRENNEGWKDVLLEKSQIETTKKCDIIFDIILRGKKILYHRQFPWKEDTVS